MKKLITGILATALCLGCLSVLPVFADEAVEVSDAAKLAETVRKINKGELPADTNITLTADIDLTGYADVSAWEPIYRYSGTFDGAGHTISGLDWTFRLQNGGGNMPDATNPGSYVITTKDAGDGNCAADAAVALLFVETDNATLKNFTVKDSTLNLVCTFNKNYQLYVGGLIGWMNGGTLSDVKLENVDIPGFGDACVNQKYLGFAGLVSGNAQSGVTLEKVDIDSKSLIDASANIKFDVAAMIGRYTSSSPITFKSCSTAATVKAAEDVSDLSKLMWKNDGVMVGGYAAAFVARFNDNTEDGARDLFYDCKNTGTLSGAKDNAEENGFVGDRNARTDIRYEEAVPPEPTKPDPVIPDPTQPDPTTPDPTKPEPAPTTGDETVYGTILALLALVALAGTWQIRRRSV